MADHNNETHIDTQDARGAEKSGVMRWVLGIGILLAVIAMGSIALTGGISQDEAESEISVEGDATPDNTNGTDSIVSDGMDEFDTADPDSDVDASVTTVEN